MAFASINPELIFVTGNLKDYSGPRMHTAKENKCENNENKIIFVSSFLGSKRINTKSEFPISFQFYSARFLLFFSYILSLLEEIDSVDACLTDDDRRTISSSKKVKKILFQVLEKK